MSEILGKLWDGFSPVASGRYHALRAVGRLKHSVPLPVTRATNKRMFDPLFHSLPLNHWGLLRYAGPYFGVGPDVSSVGLSVSKMDKFPTYDYKMNPHWPGVKDYVYDMYADVFSLCRMWLPEECVLDLNLRASPGLSFSLYGCRNKGEALVRFADYIYTNAYVRDTPLWKVVPKVEWYSQVDILAGKVRTFIIPPLDLVLDSKVVFGHQNQLLKMHRWSAYGFSPYNGGTNRLACQLLANSYFLFFDVKGWDRVLPHLSTVYKTRLSFIPDAYYSKALYCAHHTIYSHLVLPNGDLVYKWWGNNSGSTQTTPDNILAHSYVLALALFTLYNGDVDKVNKCVAALFGDDGVVSLPFIEGLDVEGVFRSVYGSFGFELDPFFLTDDLSRLEFLGFTFTPFPYGWAPRYNSERLVAGFCFAIEHQEIEAQFSKAWTLTIMAAAGPRDVFDMMVDCLACYCETHRMSLNPVVRSYVQLGPPTYAQCVDFITGHECTYLAPFFNLEVVGIKF